MDLHQLGENLWYFHFIDEFILFSSAIIIKTKSKSSKIIIEKFLQNWISVFGHSKILSDNGGEFVSQDFIHLCENFNINITTPAESPWSNKVCERHNKILTDIVLKIKEDIKCTWETALAWAVNAKNCLMNINGFSPHQLVFSQNVKLPNVFHDQISAGTPETKLSENIFQLYMQPERPS